MGRAGRAGQLRVASGGLVGVGGGSQVAAVCGLEKYKSRLLFNAGDKPYLALRLRKGDDVLKLAGILLTDLEQVAGGAV